jgi:murein DD-endopeptidase MepM/ murein hydrolase activator NlpD
MFRKKFTLMLVPGARGILKQINIPAPIVYGVAIAALMLLTGTLLMSAKYVTNLVAKGELERLKAENQSLRSRFEEVQLSLTDLEDRYEMLADKEIMIRAIFGLPDIDAQERGLGVGGPTSPVVSSFSDAEETAYRTERDLDRLLRLSHFELQKLSEVEEQLIEYKDKLRHTPSIWPASGWVTTEYQMREDPFTGVRRMHAAMDISNRRGTTIVAPADGKVSQVTWETGLGNIVLIDHGYGIKSKYGHLLEATVRAGQRVERGQPIARMGNTGNSTGPHLHYMVFRNGKPVNPREYILN